MKYRNFYGAIGCVFVCFIFYTNTVEQGRELGVRAIGEYGNCLKHFSPQMEAVLWIWIRIQIGSIFRIFVDPDPDK